MTGLERNADIVKMASYAPLLANINRKTWNPNAIVFDSSRVFGTPSYYVQQMFSQHLGQFIVPIHYEGSGEGDPLYIVGSRETRSGDLIIKVVNVNPFAESSQVAIKGASLIGGKGTAVILAASDLMDENTLDQTQQVAPVIKSLQGLSQDFTYTFAPYSVTILRIPAL